MADQETRSSITTASNNDGDKWSHAQATYPFAEAPRSAAGVAFELGWATQVSSSIPVQELRDVLAHEAQQNRDDKLLYANLLKFVSKLKCVRDLSEDGSKHSPNPSVAGL